MLIQCPECKFSRTLDESKIPSTAQIATCPRCKARFHFRNLDDETVQARQANSENQDALFGGPEQFTPTEPEAGHNASQSAHQTPRPSEPYKEGGRDLWDHIASLGEKWEQKGGVNRGESSADEYSPSGRAGEVPWEHPERFGLAGGFFKTITRVLMRGKLFFSSMPPNAPIGKAVIFYFLLVFIYYLVNFLWAKLFSTLLMNSELTTNFEQLNASIDQFNQTSVWQFFIPIPFNAAFALVILSALFSFLFRVCGVKNVTFRRSIRILCYASSGLVFVIIPGIGVIMSILFVALSTFQGFAHSYDLPPLRAALIVVPVYFLLVLFMYLLVSAG